MHATATKVDSLYCVVLGKEVIAIYSSPQNAKDHRDVINMAISNPTRLNQKPGR